MRFKLNRPANQYTKARKNGKEQEFARPVIEAGQDAGLDQVLLHVGGLKDPVPMGHDRHVPPQVFVVALANDPEAALANRSRDPITAQASWSAGLFVMLRPRASRGLRPARCSTSPTAPSVDDGMIASGLPE